jgi:general transcription factor 3C polypeptide 1
MRFFKQIPGSQAIQNSNRGLKSGRPPFCSNFEAIILDEIALEGLDGITMSTLKDRLKSNESLQMELNDEIIIEIIREKIRQGNVSVFRLEEARKPFKIFDRYEFIDSECVVLDPTEIPFDPYPFKIVNDNGVVGSCSTYETRKPLNADFEIKGKIKIIKYY